MLDQLVVFGASGDLTARLLGPALAELASEGALGHGFRLLGVAVQEWDDERFRQHLRDGIEAHGSDAARAGAEDVVRAARWATADVTDAEAMARVLADIEGPLAAYLALPSSLFAPVLSALADADPPAGSVVAVEKPFGTDLESAQELNRLLQRRLPQVPIFRNDHFLHSQTVQNILGLRFGSRLLEPVWNRENVESVEIVWDETLALEGRAGYYDRSGALRDMLQNHLMQVLCLVAMEPPADLDGTALRDARLAVLRATHPPGAHEMAEQTVRGRYTAGSIEGRRVPAYVDSDGVDPDHGTETFAQVTLGIDSWRWAGVPFTLRSGKALDADRSVVRVRFRTVPHPVFAGVAPDHPCDLRISMHPPAFEVDVRVNTDGELFGLQSTTLRTDLPDPVRSPYAGLVLDVLRGDETLFVSGDEAEQAWRIMDPVLAAWAADEVPLRSYKAGSSGPGQENSEG